MAKRKSTGKKRRFELFKRDGFTCQYCGATPPRAVLVLDHIIPVAAGGSSDDDNLVTACEVCNQGKAARSLSQVPQSLADKAAAIAESEEQLRGFHAVMEERRIRIEEDAWTVAEIFIEAQGKDDIRKDWFRSIKHFNEKLGLYVVREAMGQATDKVRWEGGCFRYFCAICWNKIREQASA